MMALVCSAALPTMGSRMVTRKGSGMPSCKLAPCHMTGGEKETSDPRLLRIYLPVTPSDLDPDPPHLTSMASTIHCDSTATARVTRVIQMKQPGQLRSGVSSSPSPPPPPVVPLVPPTPLAAPVPLPPESAQDEEAGSDPAGQS